MIKTFEKYTKKQYMIIGEPNHTNISDSGYFKVVNVPLFDNPVGISEFEYVQNIISGEVKPYYYTYEEAKNKLKSIKNKYFGTKFKIIPAEEIDLLIKTNKYNL